MPVFEHRVSPAKRKELLEKHGDRVRASVFRATFRSAQANRAEVVNVTPSDTGLLRRSWRVYQTRTGGLDVLLENAEPYAAIAIEQGRRAGKWPPGDYNHAARMLWSGPIFDWVWRKLRITAEKLYGRTGKRAKGLRTLLTARAAYKVARKIALKGIAPKWIIRSRIPRWTRDLARAVKREVDADFGTKP